MNGDSYSRDGGRHGGSRGHYSTRDDDREGRRDRDRGDRGDRRRRSRSPNRRRDYEVDTYSSSRQYRERERETVHDRREGRRDGGDRAWDRDRPQRRDPRRDDDDRTARRERDPFEDRGAGGGGRGRRDRGDRGDREFGGGGRRRSATPPVKRREPTPDLTGVVSIQQRERRQTQWDIKPVGYENITAEQAKLSGMFPLPGAPRTQPMDPTRLQAFMNQPAGSASTSALKPANAKQAKRVLVHNIPAGVTNEYMADFFNLQMNGVNLASGPDPCVSAHISQDKSYALMEFKTPEDATYALALNGIVIPTDDYANGGMQVDRPGLSIRRPKDYIAPAAPEQTGPLGDDPDAVVKDGPNKLSVTGVPVDIERGDLLTLLQAFGQLRAFSLAVDEDGNSRGIAFCEFSTDESTDIALEGLNGIQLGDNHLKVQRACVGIAQAAGLESVSAMTMLAATQTKETDETRVLMLLNMVTIEELNDADNYREIYDDVKDECIKYGNIIEMKIPRPKGPRIDAGVGKIFIKYDSVSSAQRALKALAGRKFADRTVVVTYYSEELFDVNAW